MASDDRVSEVPKHHICYIHLAHGVAEASPGLRGRVQSPSLHRSHSNVRPCAVSRVLYFTRSQVSLLARHILTPHMAKCETGRD